MFERKRTGTSLIVAGCLGVAAGIWWSGGDTAQSTEESAQATASFTASASGPLGPIIVTYLTDNDFGCFRMPDGDDEAVLHILNRGDATLTGTISFEYVAAAVPPEPWLSPSASGPFIIVAGSPPIMVTLTMSKAGLCSGEFLANIVIDHNQVDVPDPLIIPVAFNVCAPCGDLDCTCTNDIVDVVKIVDITLRGISPAMACCEP